MQHFLDEHRKNDVERFFIRGGRRRRRIWPGPQPAFVKIVTLRGNLVHSLDRIQARHVKRDRKQLDIDGGLGDGTHRGEIGFLEAWVAI